MIGPRAVAVVITACALVLSACGATGESDDGAEPEAVATSDPIEADHTGDPADPGDDDTGVADPDEPGIDTCSMVDDTTIDAFFGTFYAEIGEAQRFIEPGLNGESATFVGCSVRAAADGGGSGPGLTWGVRDADQAGPDFNTILEFWEGLLDFAEGERHEVDVAGFIATVISTPSYEESVAPAHRLLVEHELGDVVVSSVDFFNRPETGVAEAEASLEHVVAVAEDLIGSLDGGLPNPIELDPACPSPEAPALVEAADGVIIVARSLERDGVHNQLNCQYASADIQIMMTGLGPSSDGDLAEMFVSENNTEIEIDGDPAVVSGSWAGGSTVVADTCLARAHRYPAADGRQHTFRLSSEEDLLGLEEFEAFRTPLTIDLLQLARDEMTCPAPPS